MTIQYVATREAGAFEIDRGQAYMTACGWMKEYLRTDSKSDFPRQNTEATITITQELREGSLCLVREN